MEELNKARDRKMRKARDMADLEDGWLTISQQEGRRIVTWTSTIHQEPKTATATVDDVEVQN